MSDHPWLTRRQFLAGAGLTAVGGIAGTGLYAGEIARHEIDVTQVTVKIRRLPDSFHGFRIVQISDIHYKEYTEEFFLRRVLRRVNDLRPDAVVMTGDFVSAVRHDLKPGAKAALECADVLRMLDCPHRYGIMGNHDFYIGENWVSGAIRESATTILLNESVPLEKDGKRIWLCGVRDCFEHAADLEKALPDSVRNSGEPIILLAHEPDFADTALKMPAGRNVDLMLSGHTHGGQVRLPLLPPLKAILPPMGEKYVEGLFHLGGMQLHVNRGIGTTGVPFRLNCPPEITVLTFEQGD